MNLIEIAILIICAANLVLTLRPYFRKSSIKKAHESTLHGSPVECPECHARATKYDERGVCVNCVADGK